MAISEIRTHHTAADWLRGYTGNCAASVFAAPISMRVMTG
jgi:hypothetical protein